MDEKEKQGISRRDFVKLASAGAAAIAGTGVLSPLAAQAQGTAPGIPTKWDLEADVVVIGAGAVGLPAAIRAADAGASVIVVDTNYDIGGHAIVSGGNTPLAAGRAPRRNIRSKIRRTSSSAI